MDQIGGIDLNAALGAMYDPQQRVRSHTWPPPHLGNYVGQDEMKLDENNSLLYQATGGSTPPKGGKLLPKKKYVRRNPWGDLSYAAMITQAITSAPDQRLTLPQIYDWMIKNVDHFKEKGKSKSSAGWKNSIRHNLSLHECFMKVRNEEPRKSSWWMINPHALPGKTPRRRAASMDTTQKLEKRRGRAKKKLEAMTNGVPPSYLTPSPSSSTSENRDMFSVSPISNSSGNASNGNPGFQLTPDFRPKAPSNASSCSRLPPISANEQYNQAAPLYPLGGQIPASDCSDLTLEGLTMLGGLECDVEQVIKHELRVHGRLDFNFSEFPAPPQNQVHFQPYQGPPYRVH